MRASKVPSSRKNAFSASLPFPIVPTLVSALKTTTRKKPSSQKEKKSMAPGTLRWSMNRYAMEEHGKSTPLGPTFLISTMTSGMVCRIPIKSLSASVNLPSVVVLYATFSLSSSWDSLKASAGALGVLDADCTKVYFEVRKAHEMNIYISMVNLYQ
jgi:hypothetical protein